MANYNYGHRYPVHNYGSDKIRSGVQHWIQGKAQKQAALLKAIVETAPYMDDFTPGSQAYDKIEETFGPQVTGAIAKRASADKMQRATQAQLNSFDIGSGYMNAIQTFVKMNGEEDSYKSPTFKILWGKAREEWGKAGVKIGTYDEYKTYKENLDQVKTDLSNNVLKKTRELAETKEVTPQIIKGHRAALTKYTSSKFHDKDVATAYKSMIDESSKRLQSQEAEDRKRKKATMFRLPNGDIVRSFDDKRYYGKDGKLHPLPYDSTKYSSTYTGAEEGTMLAARKEAGQPAVSGMPAAPITKQTAEAGTGLWANVGAALDAIAGGLGLDKVVGQDGFFNDTQDARQQLRLLKQTGKSALLNSARGAIWEQMKIDELFPDPDKLLRNPRTEARKIDKLRRHMLKARRFNNEAIKNAVDKKEVLAFRASNNEIDAVLAQLVSDSTTLESTLTDEENALIDRY